MDEGNEGTFETRAPERLSRAYGVLLDEYLRRGKEETLYRASLLSLDFVSSDLGPEDITSVHAAVMHRLLGEQRGEQARRAIKAAHHFLLEVMIHYGVKYREYREAEVERALRAADEAARVEHEKASLLSSIAHEIGTPVTVAQGFVQRARRRAERDGYEDLSKNLREALDALDRLATLNQSLREASADGSARALQVEPHAIGPILESVATWAELIAEQAGVRLQRDLREPDLEVLCDPNAITTICSNLLTNAIRYTERGGAVHLRQGAEDSRAWIEVADTGIGMTPEVQRQVFRRFYRGPEAEQRSTGGLGLGLATTKELAESQHGHLEFESEAGRGTTFRVYLDVADGGKQRPSSAE